MRGARIDVQDDPFRELARAGERVDCDNRGSAACTPVTCAGGTIRQALGRVKRVR